jgi:hypothetical protein
VDATVFRVRSFLVTEDMIQDNWGMSGVAIEFFS